MTLSPGISLLADEHTSFKRQHGTQGQGTTLAVSASGAAMAQFVLALDGELHALKALVEGGEAALCDLSEDGETLLMVACSGGKQPPEPCPGRPAATQSPTARTPRRPPPTYPPNRSCAPTPPSRAGALICGFGVGASRPYLMGPLSSSLRRCACPRRPALQSALPATRCLARSVRTGPGAASDGRARPHAQSAPRALPCVGHVDTIAALLEMGADAYQKDDTGMTALIKAAREDNADAVKVLCEHYISDGHGDDLDDTDQSNLTALGHAAWHGSVGSLKALLRFSVDVDKIISNGNTALQLAAGEGHEDVVEQLIGARASITTADKEQETALMKASMEGHDGLKAFAKELVRHYSPPRLDATEADRA